MPSIQTFIETYKYALVVAVLLLAWYISSRPSSSSSSKSVIFLYSPSCGYCTKFQPMWEATISQGRAHKEAIEGSSAKGAKYTQQYEVSGYPTVLFFDNGVLSYKQEGLPSPAQWQHLLNTYA